MTAQVDLISSEVQITFKVNGTYSGLRPQSTTKGDVGLGNVEKQIQLTHGVVHLILQSLDTTEMVVADLGSVITSYILRFRHCRI